MFVSKTNPIVRAHGCLFCLLAFVFLTRGLSAGQLPDELARATRALYGGDYQRAASLAEAYVKTHPSSAKGLSLLARAEIAQGQYQSGYDTLTKALHKAPRDTDVLYYLSQISTIMAQIEFRHVQELDPNSVRVHQLLAESYRARGNKAQAAEEYKEALKLAPHSVELLEAMGDLERSDFHFNRATTYYSQALRINPRSYASAYGMGASYLFLQEPKKAMPYFQTAISIAPQSAEAHFGLGDAFLRCGEVHSAVAELNEAVHLQPKMREAYTLLARAYKKLGLEAKAQEALVESQRLTSEEIKSRQRIIGNGRSTGPTTR